MRFLLALPLLTVLVVAYTSSSKENGIGLPTTDYYPEDLVIYRGEHDIVDIMVPLNKVNDKHSIENSSEISNFKKPIKIFFVEADIQHGHSEGQGIYIYRDGEVTKILDKGTAVDASADESKYVFLGSKDGLYIYNPVTQKAEKYGTFNKSIKDIAKEDYTDVIYILTEDRELYKVYDSGSKSVKIDDVKDAEQMVLDFSNNLYYYSKDNKPYVRHPDGTTTKIKGLPAVAREVKLFRPVILSYKKLGFMIDNVMYTIHSDGTSVRNPLEFSPDKKPTALSIELGIIKYIAREKKLYELD